ncbi:VapA/VapB family virulence-associated protein [Xenorhabdus griffiniae]|uniref:VapA/VapB family virulence-associated protein n=1 Tax=Xenorhabdus griffiniae TaxID=351672 RepID=A0ABY9XID6_9GAMM|nr:VapA/VapB family virulence-associated protein [Xenorhabdus griffiniae]MBD1227796.1 VapA/VapB family virulence-associated protein [Xenorhabdus griffiniae]MBE8587212.1 VapA/VapB family virulence-associated protein [Xenorhabdus griffiniae]WMV72651.1 VapA/VapB family virulence-associated protein [Xenorhabdus griffiniae]WNH02330.1 VapA/VapB family virulence-associated protein [Xenorhabdus griffiniae]
MNELEKNEIKLKLIENFKQTMQGKLEPKKINEAVTKIASQKVDAYSAGGHVESLIFYLKFYLRPDFIENKKSFRGQAGGLTTPGFATIQGFIFTDDLDTLYSDTVHFAFEATPVSFGLHFFDSDSYLLGSFGGLAISLIAGVGGGSGSWS